jgi:hypothetical protein
MNTTSRHRFPRMPVLPLKGATIRRSSLGSAATSLALALPLLAWGTVAQAQEYKGPIWGGSGGTWSYNLDCASTGVMIGVYGKTGAWIDQIGIICHKVNSDGTLGDKYTVDPWVDPAEPGRKETVGLDGLS